MKPITVGRVVSGHDRSGHAQIPCHGIPVGLPVLTAEGERSVEHLSAGDYIDTRNGGLIRLDAIHVTTQTARAILFAAGCFGATSPIRDLILPADQPVLVRGRHAQGLFGQTQAMTAAAQLVDGEGVVDVGPRLLTLCRLTFDRPRVIRAGGLELGTSHAASLPLRAVA